MPGTLRFILGDQLSRSISCLTGLDPATDTVLMAEVMEEATYVRHHKRKIAFLFSAMRHFAAELRAEGIRVLYLRLGEEPSVSSFTDALRLAAVRCAPARILATEPGEWRVLEMMKGWERKLGVPVEIRQDTRFFASRESFARHAETHRRGLTLEFFYREMRRTTGILMAGDAPEGGLWNFDKENREPLPPGLAPPSRPEFPPDAITGEVLALVGERFAEHFGDLDGFDYPVTRDGALAYLDWFVETALPSYGAYQDAMKQGEPLLFHSHLSALLNCGLLLPPECCRRAEDAWHAGDAPLNSVEGFIRQILGWREYIRGVYWLKMPGYAAENRLGATKPLPWFFWDGETDMNCMRHAIGETKASAYAHHIQRLMVIGNFCLIAGLDPREVQEWYLVVYHDAYEWVEMPNVLGLILYADGGFMASKPYAASGAYINRMSDYCGKCRYDVKARTGPEACPFNYLYWDFLERRRSAFQTNVRMRMSYRTLDRMSDERREAIRASAASFLADLS